jgi:hypothetical protein
LEIKFESRPLEAAFWRAIAALKANRPDLHRAGVQFDVID